MAEHDLAIPILLTELNKLYSFHMNRLTLFVMVQGIKYEYMTHFESHDCGGMDYQFLDTNGDPFFNIYIDENGITEVSIELVDKTVKGIGSLKALETVFFLTTWFCTMAIREDEDAITHLILIDAAHSICKDDLEHTNEYPLKVYRMFSTRLPAACVSIYSKFFQYRQVPMIDDFDQANLDRIRRFTIGYVKHFSQAQIKSTSQKLDDPLTPPDQIRNLLRELKLFEKHIDSISSLPKIYDHMTIADFFDTFLRKQNCQEYSVLLKSINKFLQKDEDYQTLFKKITNYTVRVSDSIYYDNVNPTSMYRGTRSRRKRRSKRIS